MKFTTSDGYVISENMIKRRIIRIIEELKQIGYTNIFLWEKDLTEWFLDKNIEGKNNGMGTIIVQLHEGITENELKQLEQLIDYLRL